MYRLAATCLSLTFLAGCAGGLSDHQYETICIADAKAAKLYGDGTEFAIKFGMIRYELSRNDAELALRKARSKGCSI